MRFYLDTAVVIYLIEGDKELVDTVLSYLQGTKTGQDVVLISDITRLECRVKPLREKNEILLKCYDDFFESKEVVKVEISPMVWDLATNIRAQYTIECLMRFIWQVRLLTNPISFSQMICVLRIFQI